MAEDGAVVKIIPISKVNICPYDAATVINQNLNQLLCFQVTFNNPVIERRSKLQRQRRIFPKEKGDSIYSYCMACNVILIVLSKTFHKLLWY